MSYWSDILLTGSGSVDYRLMVEGWPHEWVTDPRITHATNKGERIVYAGLQYTGLRISERAILRDAWPQVTNMTVTITPTARNDDTVSSFTRDSLFVGNLAVDLSESDTNWTTLPVSLGAGIYHMATEAVSCDGSDNIARGHWDTNGQKHVTTIAGITNPVPIYSWPPSMEGRRAFLYAYGTAEDPAGDGNIIWRGTIVRPPRLSPKDGLSWNLIIEPITKVFEQNVGGGDPTEYRVRGIYHSSSAPFTYYVNVGNVHYPPSFVTSASRVTGFYEDNNSLVADGINPSFAAVVADAASELSELYCVYSHGYPTYNAQLTSDVFFSIIAVDLIDGDTSVGSPAYLNGEPGHNGDRIDPGGFYVVSPGDSSGNFFVWSGNINPPYGYPLPKGRTYVGKAQISIEGGPLGSSVAGLGLVTANYTDPDDTTWPNNRVYLESVEGLVVGDKLVVKDTGDEDHSPYILDITTVDTTDRFIEIDMSHSGSFYLSSDMTMVKITEYANKSNWAGFMDAVVTASPDANVGVTPWITSDDVNIANWLAVWDTYPFNDYWRKRDYSFVTPVTVKEVLVPELQVTGWMTRLGSDGRLDVVQMPFVSSQRSAAHSISDEDILLPAAGSYGEWPTWEAQNDGLVNIAYLKLGYSPFDDDYDAHFDFIVRLTSSIAEHKSGDKAKQEIGPKSRPSSGGTLKKRLADLPPPADIADMVLPFLQTLSKDYAIVTLAVPFTKFAILCGDIVSITCSLIPDGLGGRGVSGKKAICVGRDWDLDPSTNKMGRLTFWFPRDTGRNAGYAPTGRITGHTNTTGDIWVLTFSAADSRNLAWSEDSDGDVVKHFEVGDGVEILQVDVTSESRVTGTITDKPSSTQIEVTLLSTWTPGSDTWNMRFTFGEAGPGLSAHAGSYCWVADSGGQFNVQAGKSFV